MSVIFLLIAGPGPWSIDALLARKRHPDKGHAVPA
jgi:hypothetical protein